MDRMAAGLIAVSVLVGLSPFIADEVLLEKTRMEYESNVSIVKNFGNYSEVLGIGLNPGQNLRYGTIPQETTVHKSLKLYSPDRSYVTVRSTGNISTVVNYRTGFFFQNRTELEFDMKAKKRQGYYEGKIILSIQRPVNSWGLKWLELKSRFY